MSIDSYLNPYHKPSYNVLTGIADKLVTNVTPNVTTVKNAIILTKHSNVNPASALTGVYYPDGDYVPEGVLRRFQTLEVSCTKKNLSEVSPDLAEPQSRLPAGIWGGHIFARKSYGHIILESFSRLWYVLENTTLPIYVTVASLKEFEWFCSHFASLNLPFSQFVPILKTSQVDELIIPSQSFMVSYGGGPKFIESIQRVTPVLEGRNSSENMLYFSRAGYAGRGHRTIIGEQFLEATLQEAGVKILRLEAHSFWEKLNIINAHAKIGGFTGSGHHHNIFTENKHVSYLTNGLAPFKMHTYLAHETLVGNRVTTAQFSEYLHPFGEDYWRKVMNFWGEGPQLINFQDVLDHYYEIGFLPNRIRFHLTDHMRAEMRKEVLQSMEASLKFSGRVGPHEQKIRNHMEMRLKTLGLGE